MRKIAKLTINSHNIVFSNMNSYIKELLKSFCARLIHYDRKKQGIGKIKVVKKAVYAASNISRTEIRFHINHKDEILKYLKNEGFSEDNFEIVNTPIVQGEKVNFEVIDKRKPFDYQVPIINYLTSPGKTKTITLGTGDGKTFAAIKAITSIGRRTMVVILGRYVSKWIKDFENSIALKKGDLLVIRGYKDLISLMNLAIAGELTAKVIICTSNTLQRYIKDYELGGDRGFPIEPNELYEKLNIGIKLIDECHQFFHLNYKMDLYTNVEKAIFLSATLEPSNAFLNRMYKVIYPLDTRFQGKSRDKYIDVSALSYTILSKKKVRCIMGGSYSHVSFENQIIHNPNLLKAYLEMIWDITKSNYIDVKLDGQKMLIFASTINMCIKIRDFIADRISKDLTVAKYTAEDPIEHLHEKDIVISTLGSAGTAVDIINLKTCLMTVSIASMQANIQALGRLRKLVNYPNDNPEFIYIYSPNINKQFDYHREKFGLFKDLCRSHKTYVTNHTLDYSKVRY